MLLGDSDIEKLISDGVLREARKEQMVRFLMI